jgi:hypothetical protein
MARKLKIKENEKYTLQDVKYGEEKWKRWKIKKCPLWDMYYVKKTENHGKWKIHTSGRGVWRGILKKVDNLEMSTVGHGIWGENWKSWTMRNIHLTTWKMMKSLKKWKMRNTHCRTWNKARKLKIMENEKYTL